MGYRLTNSERTTTMSGLSDARSTWSSDVMDVDDDSGIFFPLFLCSAAQPRLSVVTANPQVTRNAQAHHMLNLEASSAISEK